MRLRWSCRVRSCDGRAACGCATVMPRVVLRRPCRARGAATVVPRVAPTVVPHAVLRPFRNGRAAFGGATAVPRVARQCRARCRYGRAACGAATVVPRAAPTVVPRVVLRRCRDGRGACGAATVVPRAVVARAVPRRPCRAGHAVCGRATVVQRAVLRRCCDGATACGAAACGCDGRAAWVVRRWCGGATVVQWSSCAAAIVVPFAVLRPACRVRCCDGRAVCGAAWGRPFPSFNTYERRMTCKRRLQCHLHALQTPPAMPAASTSRTSAACKLTPTANTETADSASAFCARQNIIH